MPRTSKRFALATLGVALAWQTAWAEDGLPQNEPDHLGHPTAVVGIAPSRLLPSTLVIAHDSALGWLNYSSSDATITFDTDITRKLTCRSPGQFRAESGDIASPRVAGGAFVTLCSLAPGEYSYHVEFDGRHPRLVGKVVVEVRSAVRDVQ